MIDTQLDSMCTSLYEYMHEVPPIPYFDDVQKCVGYMVHDAIDCTAVDGYKTAFAWLANHKRLTNATQKIDENLAMLVPSGQFSYANINPSYIFGVSGTVAQLDMYQRAEVLKYGLLAYTTVPSVFGKFDFRFLEQDDAIKVVEADDYFQAIAVSIQQVIQKARAIVVFFESVPILNEFMASSFASALPPSLQLLVEDLAHDEKLHRTKKAANTGQITLATSVFGRGSDFTSYDSRLQENGGVHVLYTFVPLTASEEWQGQGRTARQGQKRSFGLLLSANDLMERLNLPSTLLQDGQSEGYKRIQAARMKKQEAESASIAKDLQKAEAHDSISRAFVAALHSGDHAAALAAYASFHDRYLQKASFFLIGESHHYIICLDSSATMEEKIKPASEAVVKFVEEAGCMANGPRSVISLVMFDHVANTTLRESPLSRGDVERAIHYTAGGTNFTEPLVAALRLVSETKDKYHKHFILLYTDGEEEFPGEAAQEMQSFRAKYSKKLEFFAISEDSYTTMRKVCSTLYEQAEAGSCCR